MPYFPKAEAPNVAPYWCPNCAAWYLPQCGPLVSSCCVIHPPGSCCHHGETKLVAEGSQPQPVFVPWNQTITATPCSVCGKQNCTDTHVTCWVDWGKSMQGDDTSHMVDS